MCGRYTLVEPAPTLAEIFAAELLGDLPAELLRPRYNIAPSQTILIVRSQEGARRIVTASFGAVSAAGSMVLNARAETMGEKRTFRAAFANRRCIVPASGFFEWQRGHGGKDPSLIRPADALVLALAGLWSPGIPVPHRGGHGEAGKLDVCWIVTVDANEDVAPLHDRMPAVIRREHIGSWLDPGTPEPVLHEIIAAGRGVALSKTAVSRRVNRVENDDEDCIAAVNPAPRRQLRLFE